MKIQRRKGTQNSSMMPLDPKVEREEKERNALTSINDSIQNLHVCRNRYIYNDPKALEKQPWRSHPRGCREDESRRSEFQERQF